MMRRNFALLLAAASLFVVWSSPSLAQNARAYTEGPVLQASYIRTEPGKFDEYLQYLATTYKTIMEEQKKAGIILDYAVYSNEPQTPTDPDIILTITYANLAALDNLDAGLEPGHGGSRRLAHTTRQPIASAVDPEIARQSAARAANCGLVAARISRIALRSSAVRCAKYSLASVPRSTSSKRP
jgi:hypothetical protein